MLCDDKSGDQFQNHRRVNHTLVPPSRAILLPPPPTTVLMEDEFWVAGGCPHGRTLGQATQSLDIGRDETSGGGHCNISSPDAQRTPGAEP